MAKMNYEKQARREKGATGVQLDRNEFLQKIYLEVPFDEKESAKAAGAKWDSCAKKWYCFGMVEKFRKWMGKTAAERCKKKSKKRK